MPIFQFPASPTEGQIYAPAGGPQYVYRAPYWRASGRVDTIVAETPPVSPKNGQLWFNSSTGNTYIWYEDPNSAQWVQTNAGIDTDTTADDVVDWDEIEGKPATFPPTVPIAWADVSGKPATFPPTLPIPQSGITNLVADLQAKRTQNYLVNGGFRYWQRNTTGTTGYIVDRWTLAPGAGSSNTVSRNAFAPGDATYEDIYFLNWARATAGSAASTLTQKIDNVVTLQGKTVTVTLWASAGAATSFNVSLIQHFGTGGSPSANVTVGPTAINVTPPMAKYSAVFSLASLAGKTLGTVNDGLWLQISRLHTATNPTTPLYLSHVSLTEGDQSAAADPFLARSDADELALCLRYYQRQYFYIDFYATGAGQGGAHTMTYPCMRAVPTVSLAATGTSTNATAGIHDAMTTSSMRVGATATAAGQVAIYARWLALDAEV